MADEKEINVTEETVLQYIRGEKTEIGYEEAAQFISLITDEEILFDLQDEIIENGATGTFEDGMEEIALTPENDQLLEHIMNSIDALLR
jgi:hypothetical protein